MLCHSVQYRVVDSSVLLRSCSNSALPVWCCALHVRLPRTVSNSKKNIVRVLSAFWQVFAYTAAIQYATSCSQLILHTCTMTCTCTISIIQCQSQGCSQGGSKVGAHLEFGHFGRTAPKANEKPLNMESSRERPPEPSRVLERTDPPPTPPPTRVCPWAAHTCNYTTCSFSIRVYAAERCMSITSNGFRLTHSAVPRAVKRHLR